MDSTLLRGINNNLIFETTQSLNSILGKHIPAFQLNNRPEIVINSFVKNLTSNSQKILIPVSGKWNKRD